MTQEVLRRHVNRLRAQMIDQGRTVPEIAVELRIKFQLSPLAAYRTALGLSQADVVDRYALQPTGTYLDQALLSRFETFPTGGRAPLATHITTLAAVYGTRPLDLLDADRLDRLDRQEREILIRCNAGYALAPLGLAGDVIDSTHDTAPARPLVRPAITDDPLKEAVRMAARRARRFATLVQGGNVGPETLPQLRDDVARVARDYPRTPLNELLPEMSELQEVIYTLLEGRQRPDETADLYMLAGVVGGMLAKASHDSGDPHAAMTQARAAFMCAERIGHNALAAWVLTLQSMITYWSGSPHKAARYAEDAAGLAVEGNGTVAVWVAAQHARTLGVLGDHEGVHASVRRALAARERVIGDDLDELGGIMTFPAPRQSYYAADAYVWMPGGEQEAIQAASHAISAYADAAPADRSFSDEAGAHCDLALAWVALGELDGAAEALVPVLDLPAGQRIEGIAASLQRVHIALRDPQFRGTSLAEGLRMQIEAFRSVPVRALSTGR
ncbi:hypothetical protein ACFWYW_23730 [Nonomuraea sp. NPDC059023]|uniref:hypothetical protein n=1 Tax=unclassified Nonomuraea TaxID=2593643 RepID=UPI0036A83B36